METADANHTCLYVEACKVVVLSCTSANNVGRWSQPEGFQDHGFKVWQLPEAQAEFVMTMMTFQRACEVALTQAQLA